MVARLKKSDVYFEGLNKIRDEGLTSKHIFLISANPLQIKDVELELLFEAVRNACEQHLFEIGQQQYPKQFFVFSQHSMILMNNNRNCSLNWTKQCQSQKSENVAIDTNMQTCEMHSPLYNHVGEILSLQDYANYFARNTKTKFCTNRRKKITSIVQKSNLSTCSSKDIKAFAISPNLRIRSCD